MQKDIQQIDNFQIIGIDVITSNVDGKSVQDISNLWNRFYEKNISDKISNRLSDDVYAIYTDYESNFEGMYRVILGLTVDSVNEIPEGLVGLEIQSGTYKKFVAKGDAPKSVVETWNYIWSNDSKLNRLYTADFEVYGAKSNKGKYSEVSIYVAVE